MDLVLLFLAAFGITVATVPPLRRWAWRVGLVDRPRDGAHKTHAQATPYGGGAAIWLAIVVCGLAGAAGRRGDAVAQQTIAHLVLAGTVLFLTGLADDRRPLPPLPRLALQIGALAILVATTPALQLPLATGAPWLSRGLTVLWLAAMTNAFNFLDNMDGLAAGIAALVGAGLAVMAVLGGQLEVALLAGVTAAASAGFLCYNFPRASVFMGDAGGLLLGLLAGALGAWLAHARAATGAGPGASLLPLVLLAVPAYDLVTVSVLRLAHGRPPWLGDRNHISHRLVALGLSRQAAVGVIFLGVVLFAAAPMAVSRGSQAAVAAAWIGSGVGLALLLGLDFRARRRRAHGNPA